MKNSTDEFSFILKPSTVCDGVGVFSTHAIKEGTHLRLFGDDVKLGDLVRKKKDVPEFFHAYCIDQGADLICPKDFGSMSVGWHMNHSKAPVATHRDLDWYAARDIFAGEEIVIDYNTLGEPEES